MKSALALLALALPAHATDLVLPFPATSTLTETRALGSHRIATGRFDGTLPSVTAEGAVVRSTWQLSGAETTLQILTPLREQLMADGWTEVFECATRTCGGFDFRFEIDVSPAPQMFVDLADFRYLAARKGDAWTTLLVSRSGALDFVQTTRVDPDASVSATLSTSNVPTAGTATGGDDVARQLATAGHVVLADLDFATGSTALPQSDYASLDALARAMRDAPAMTIALVGHTDNEGGTDGNLTLSRERAESVRRLMIERHGIAPERMESRGVAYFSPLARNDSEGGRRANRRVEAVITSRE